MEFETFEKRREKKSDIEASLYNAGNFLNKSANAQITSKVIMVVGSIIAVVAEAPAIGIIAGAGFLIFETVEIIQKKRAGKELMEANLTK